MILLPVIAVKFLSSQPSPNTLSGAALVLTLALDRSRGGVPRDHGIPGGPADRYAPTAPERQPVLPAAERGPARLLGGVGDG